MSAPIHQQRRAKNAQSDDRIRAFLRVARLGHIATVLDGQPFINPTTFWYDPAAHALYFHSNVVGRMRTNANQAPVACFSASEMGRFLPANTALEFSVQYESVIAYGTLAVLTDPAAQRLALQGLIDKYFPNLTAGQEYRPITEVELKHTSVYALHITAWSGKRNWAAQADHDPAWPALSHTVLATVHGPTLPPDLL